MAKPGLCKLRKHFNILYNLCFADNSCISCSCLIYKAAQMLNIFDSVYSVLRANETLRAYEDGFELRNLGYINTGHVLRTMEFGVSP